MLSEHRFSSICFHTHHNATVSPSVSPASNTYDYYHHQYKPTIIINLWDSWKEHQQEMNNIIINENNKNNNNNK